MSRNRIKQPASVRFGPAVKIFLLCLMLGAFGIGYVGQKNQLYVLSSQYKEAEKKLDRLQRENAVRSRMLDSLQSLSELEARIQEMHMGLVPPEPHQVVRLVDEVSEGTPMKEGGLYAGSDPRAGSVRRNAIVSK